MSKQNIIKGTFILTAAGLLTRILGFANRIFLTRIIGIYELGVYQMIFPIYILAVSFCVQGLSTIISKQVSFALGQKRKDIAKISFFVSTLFSLILSLLTYSLLFNIAKPISLYILKNSSCIKLIQSICLALPFVSIKGCINAYFITTNHPIFNGLSLLTEQFTRIISTYLLSIYWCKSSANATLAVVAVLLGEIVSALLTIFIYLYYVESQDKFIIHPKKANHNPLIYLDVIKCIIKDYIPLTTNNLSITIFSTIESMFLPSMLFLFYKDNNLTLELFGALTGVVFPFIMFPGTITNSLSTMLMPSISFSHAENNNYYIKKALIKISQFCFLLGILTWIFYFFFGIKLCVLTFKSIKAGYILKKMCFICPFIFLSGVLSTIENSLDKTANTLFFNLLSITIRFISLFFFVPHFGLSAYIYGTGLGAITLCILLFCNINYTISEQT